MIRYTESLYYATLAKSRKYNTIISYSTVNRDGEWFKGIYFREISRHSDIPSIFRPAAQYFVSPKGIKWYLVDKPSTETSKVLK